LSLAVHEQTRLRSVDGESLALPVARWMNDATGADASALSRVLSPVLDVGCGPGRHLQALAGRGVVALGLDTCESAVALARARGVSVLKRSVFDPVPGAGRWATELLLDGNMGIGGRPVDLLKRVGRLLQTRGRVILEMEGPMVATNSLTARVEAGPHLGPWFPWARVSINDIETLAPAARMVVVEKWVEDRRWFAYLEKTS